MKFSPDHTPPKDARLMGMNNEPSPEIQILVCMENAVQKCANDYFVQHDEY
jgi:hypothetical protein